MYALDYILSYFAVVFLKLLYKTKQFFFVLIKLSIVFGAFYFIYDRLTTNTKLDFETFVSVLNKKVLFSTKNIILLMLLSFFNWFFEILKWKTLVTPIKKINFRDALSQSLGALTVSLITPNRIGEYGAKAIYFIPKYRKRIILLNFISNAMQMSITVLFGAIGLIMLTQNNNIVLNFVSISRVFVFTMLLTILMVVLLKQNKYKINGVSTSTIKHFIRNLPLASKIIPLSLSITRYIIFSYQFYFLLLLFNTELSYLVAMTYISSLYLLSSILPSIFILDVIVKGSIAVYLFSLININELTILTIITIMWLLNVVIPSFFGSICVLNFNWPQNE